MPGPGVLWINIKFIKRLLFDILVLHTYNRINEA